MKHIYKKNMLGKYKGEQLAYSRTDIVDMKHDYMNVV